MRSCIFSISLICGSIAGGTNAIAQDADGAEVTHTQNAYLAPFEVIADHPDCRAAGETAYRINLEADNVIFRARGIYLDGNTNSSFTQRTPRVCYRSVRRGTEITRMRVSCAEGSSNRSPDRIEEMFGGATPQLSVSAQVTACLSIESYRILDGNWEAEYLFDSQRFRHGGPVVLEDREAGLSGDMQASMSYTPQGSILTIAGSRHPTRSMLPITEDVDLYIADTSLLHLRLDCLPVPTVPAEDRTVFSAAILAFVPMLEGESCVSGACEAPSLPSRVVLPNYYGACSRS
jgi:hypothetical protein